jgi:hypothetical protein
VTRLSRQVEKHGHVLFIICCYITNFKEDVKVSSEYNERRFEKKGRSPSIRLRMNRPFGYRFELEVVGQS